MLQTPYCKLYPEDDIPRDVLYIWLHTKAYSNLWWYKKISPENLGQMPSRYDAPAYAYKKRSGVRE